MDSGRVDNLKVMERGIGRHYIGPSERIGWVFEVVLDEMSISIQK